MTAPPTVDRDLDEADDEEVDSTQAPPRRQVVAVGPAGTSLIGSSLPDFDEDDEGNARIDPARDIVAVGEVPRVRPPVTPRRGFSAPMPTDRLRGWMVTLILTAVGGYLRFLHLGDIDNFGTGPVRLGTGLFDEAYYAVQAGEVLRNNGVEDNRAYGVVVHPPLGKQLIAVGEWLLGYNPTGWRFSSAIAGTLCVLLIVRVTRRMTRSTLVGGIAGVLLICDSVSHVMARMALLDVFQELFVLAAFTCLVADRDQVRARLAAARAEPSILLAGRGPQWWRQTGQRAGLAFGARWYRFGCGVFLGLTTSIKWSGVYWIAGFGVLSVLWDISARRAAGGRRPVLSVIRRDLFPSLWSLAVVPIGVYVGSWWAWFASEVSFPRHLLVSQTEDWSKSPGLLKLANLWQNSLWQWTWKMLDFHSHLLSPGSPGASNSNPADRHPWESKPWTWPIGTRPVLYYASQGQDGCGTGQTNCVGRIFVIGLPMLWWLSLFVAAWALWKAVARLDWRYAAVLVGYGAGYIPWFLNLDRQMYFFYVTPLAPFLVIGISLVLGDILGRAKVGVERRYLSIAVVAIYIGLVVANFAWMWPILNGTPSLKNA